MYIKYSGLSYFSPHCLIAMNPLKIQWTRMRARLRLFHSWIMVQLDLHWQTRTRERRKLVKAADWLETTLELLDAQRRATNNQANDVNVISTAYNDLLDRMANIRAQERPVEEDVEVVKSKFLGLLNLCGIKDADIPLFDDPVRVRSTRQTLITSFGIMSKSLNAAATPSRNRSRSTRNTDNYADMLIEHILADVSPDSETSPPSAEERTSGLSSMGSRLSPASQPSRQRQRNSTTIYRTHPGQLSEHAHLALSHLIHQRPPVNNNNPVITESNRAHSSQIPMRQLTPDSGDPESEVSHAPCSPSLDEGTMDRTLQNATSGSTPELPVSESSESLDIPFASLFDNEEFFSRIQDFPELEELSCPSNTASPVTPQTSIYRFPTRYSHSYARELQRVEAKEIANFSLCTSQEGIPKLSFQGSQENVEGYNMMSHSCKSHTLFDELLIVDLPDKESPENLNCSNINELIQDSRIDININNNYKPHLEDKSGLVVPGPESPKPPIPPRRPLTDSKVGRFVLQSNHSGLGTLWCHQKSNSPSQEFACHKRVSELVQPRPNECMTTGKAYMREKQRETDDVFLSKMKDQHCSPQSAGHSESLSASKRRKGNDRSALPMDHDIRRIRPVRQKLFASPDTTPSKVHSLVRPMLSTPSQVTPSHQHGRRSERTWKKRHSPAMRRLIQQKENNILSPSVSQNGPRKPLNEIYNICLNESDPLTTSSNSLTASSDAYAKSSETSPDLPLPSREEELRDRDAHYCDFTLDRQHKIDTLSPKQRQHLYRKDTKENFYMLEDPTTKEVIVRQVEGAECSPQKHLFIAPKPNTQAPRSVQSQIRPGSTSRRSSATSSSGSHRSSSSSYSPKSENRRRTSRSSSRSTTNSHPMASSTIIEHSPPDSDDGASTVPSIYTWTIEDVESCNLEKSYIRSRQARRALRAKSKPQTPRPPTSIGRDSPTSAKNNGPFEITAMVTEIDKHLNETAEGIQTAINDCDDVMTGASNFKTNHSVRDRRSVLTCSPCFIEKSLCKNYECNDSDDSFLLSQQASTSSMVFNRARASIQCSSNEPSDIPDLRHLSSAPSSNRTLSSSAPELVAHSIVNDATPDLLSELSIVEDREDIPGKSSSSGSSSCTAARCRPHISRPKASNADVRSITANSQDLPVGNQDLIDSILTDSPKSVDSSGIFAPYNSYNSPAESVGSHNGYSSTVSSSIPSSDNGYQQAKPGPSVPPPTPSKAQSEEAFASGNAPNNLDQGVKFKRPFNPVSHVSRTLHISNTRSRGVSAMAQFITPRRPMSVRSDPLANKSMFAVPPGVVTGPPKISDKKSLVKKLKKFSTNFYKKNEKIRTLANL